MNITISFEELKTKIKEIPISEVIGHYISLSKHGDNYIGKCPFHDDKHPSLSVNDKKAIYKCFACGKAGDSITFVERFCSLSFSEAILEIGKWIGITVENIYGKGKEKDVKSLWTINLIKQINNLYLQNTTDNNRSRTFKNFLLERKIAPEIAKKFLLGFATNENLILLRMQEICQQAISSLKDDLKKYGHNESVIRETLNQNKEIFKISSATLLLREIGLLQEGLKDKNDKTKYFDTFRNRIIFPIQNLSHEVVAFGSRSLDPTARAKYLNSKESFIFFKRNILYGLNHSKQKIKERDQIILVEGYMDLITLHKCGFENSVAIMGVGMNMRMINTIKYLTKNIILALDSDDAGMKAMERINYDFLLNGIMPKYVDFLPYKDPDEFLNKKLDNGVNGFNGTSELTAKISNATPFLDRVINRIIPEDYKIPELTDQKLKLLDQIFNTLAPLKDDLRALERVVVAGNRLKMKSSADSLIEIYRKFLSRISDTENKENKENKENRENKENKEKNNSSEGEQLVGQLKNDPLARIEKALIKELILHPECLQHGNLPEILEYVERKELVTLILWLKKLHYEITEQEYQTTIIGNLSRGGYSLELKEFVSSVLFQYRPKVQLEQINVSSADRDKRSIDKSLLDIRTQFEKKCLMKKRKSLLEKQKNCVTDDDFKMVANELSVVDKGINSLNVNI
ncbi:MAG: DNA primase [Oligoflexia bacterium]|nr:DNA primase [Oligoflexia bacterium]